MGRLGRLMKDIKDILFVVQARLNSQRVPNKMLKPFKGTNLFRHAITKVLLSDYIPKENFYVSVYEDELINEAEKLGVNIFKRSYESANNDNSLKKIYEWHDKLPFKYVVLISACNPLLKIETIDKFIKQFIKSDKEGGFAVFEKKTYYWDKENNPITNWGDSRIMNTKFVEPIYEAAHCLYASRMDIIQGGYWMDTKSPPEPELFVMDELEAFDIDYDWQFELGEKLWKV